METILVLNSDYTPLNITTFKRAIILVIKGKAEIIKNDVDIIRTETTNYAKPLIIRLLNYISHKMKNFRVNRQRLYKRDNNECAYCGSKKELTIDHIIPKSRGGKNSWSNLITCCLPCNLKKGDKTPDEAKMPLRFMPKTPSFLSNDSSIIKIWEEYKSSFAY
jgi:5-methylcytosine-specific restriction endonuclease McrA